MAIITPSRLILLPIFIPIGLFFRVIAIRRSHQRIRWSIASIVAILFPLLGSVAIRMNNAHPQFAALAIAGSTILWK
jgi:hypothetical protein